MSSGAVLSALGLIAALIVFCMVPSGEGSDSSRRPERLSETWLR